MDILKNRPPVLILLICIFELLGLILLPSAFSNKKFENFGLWYQIYLAISGIFSVAIIYNLWKMKKIGIFIYVCIIFGTLDMRQPLARQSEIGNKSHG